MSDIIAGKDKKNVPLLLRVILWIVVAVFCGLLGYILSHPINQILDIRDRAGQAAISGILGAIYSRLRKF